ncbi:MAG: DUF4859 domain-containing protein [Verrucomicrobiales bacterium]|nr:DUF4859 domain-containing protein [Verrucomicrobiales bacterium]
MRWVVRGVRDRPGYWLERGGLSFPWRRDPPIFQRADADGRRCRSGSRPERRRVGAGR